MAALGSCDAFVFMFAAGLVIVSYLYNIQVTDLVCCNAKQWATVRLQQNGGYPAASQEAGRKKFFDTHRKSFGVLEGGGGVPPHPPSENGSRSGVSHVCADEICAVASAP